MSINHGLYGMIVPTRIDSFVQWTAPYGCPGCFLYARSCEGEPRVTREGWIARKRYPLRTPGTGISATTGYPSKQCSPGGLSPPFPVSFLASGPHTETVLISREGQKPPPKCGLSRGVPSACPCEYPSPIRKWARLGIYYLKR